MSRKNQKPLVERVQKAAEAVLARQQQVALTDILVGIGRLDPGMEKPGPSCLRCAGLDDLEFLPAGDALLTRRVHAASPRHAIVVRISRTRRRYERQGLLVEPQALALAKQEIEKEVRT